MATAKKGKTISAKSPQAAEALKNLFYAGLGLADETNVKLHQTFNDLVKKGKTREPEVKKAVDDIRKKAVARRNELEKKFTNLIKQNEVVKSKEFQTLLKKLESVEVKTAPSAKPVAKKVKA